MIKHLKKRFETDSVGVIIGKVILGIIAIACFAVLFGFVIMWLWNYLMPTIFELPKIDYWQAVGLFVLARILFGSGGKGHKHKHHKYRKKNRFSKEIYKNCCSGDWKDYEDFWETEGKEAYENYKNRKSTNEEN
ncbi:alkaline shock response membrane anchor protein AmaP [Aureivirga sp. CE67]|uniref:alkaline shock response membrane anchor protein AmaP n=1 Tax=Aureivirga sp. CE67 TaxID=1788983 RepID=UPI001E35D371|nr:alkaline shock response membrane anchor protein AmaP [Aureivirga sp. CE67]